MLIYTTIGLNGGKEVYGMIYFIIAYAFFLFFIILSFKKRNLKNKMLIEKHERVQVLSVVFMFFYAIIGIITKDPLITPILCERTKICLPSDFEWVALIGIIAYLCWKYILVKMRDDVEGLKERMSKVESGVISVKEKIDLLLQKARIKF